MDVYGRSAYGRSMILERGNYAGRAVIDFVRCSYLGLNNHPEVIEGALAAVEHYGSLHWSCARTGLNFGLIGDLEEDLSDLFDARVIAYSSVLAANIGALPLIASGHFTGGREPLIAFDRLAHATLAFHKSVVAEETRVVTIPHNQLDELERLCQQNDVVAYICDGVYSMGGAAPVVMLSGLQERYGLFLYIDDASGISLFSQRGEGYARSQLQGPLDDRTMIAASLGKWERIRCVWWPTHVGYRAPGSPFPKFCDSACVLSVGQPGRCGSRVGIWATAPHVRARRSSAQALGQCAAVRLLPTAQKGERLPIRVVEIGDEQEVISAGRVLLEAGFYVSVIFFPTVSRGKAGLRICLTASHSDDEVGQIARAVLKILTRSSALEGALRDARASPVRGRLRRSAPGYVWRHTCASTFEGQETYSRSMCVRQDHRKRCADRCCSGRADDEDI